MRIARDAVYEGAAPRPLVILSHGNWGTPYSMGWLATRLVDEGYLVLALDHPGTSAESRTTRGRIRLWERAGDVSRALDQLLDDPTWGPRVDRARIGFVGHSFGAWTGLALAGGVYHLDRQRDACRAQPKPDQYCRAMAAPDVATVPRDGDGATQRDPRIQAYMLLAGGPFAGFEADSLPAITAPMWIATARYDEVLVRVPIQPSIQSATETVYDVGHFAFIPSCNWLGRRLRGDDLCRDLGPTSRGSLHEQVAQETLEFFGRNLRGAEARQ